MLPHDSQHLLQTGTAGALANAQAFVCRRLCADGPIDGEEGDFTLPERQWAALDERAGTCEKILPLDFPPPQRVLDLRCGDFGIEIHVDRGSGAGFVLLAIDTEPFPATAAKWKYQGIFRIDDERVGQGSDVTEITVG